MGKIALTFIHNESINKPVNETPGLYNIMGPYNVY